MTMSSHNQQASTTPDSKALHEWAPGDPLESPEQELLDHAEAGTRLDWAGEGRVDHEAMTKWGPARTVRAAVLRHLLVEQQWPVHSKGVQLRGARISGRLDLESAAVHCPLLLEDCRLDSPEPVALNYATVPRIVLSRCRVVGGLSADLLVVTKELDLGGSIFERVVRLLGANITGQLSLRGAKLTGTDQGGDALVGDQLKVGSDVIFDQGFTAAGAVRLPGANITGQLSLSGVQLSGTDSGGDALVGDGLKVGSDVVLEQVTAAGAVRLPGANITGHLSFGHAKLTGTDQGVAALVGEGLKVGGDVIFGQEFTAAGAVRLAGADITGQTVCLGKLTATDGEGDALVGDQLKVGGDVIFGQEFTAAGAVRLAGADITGQLSLRGAKLTGSDQGGDALVGDRLKVGGNVILRQVIAGGAVRLPGADITGQLSLSGARFTGTDQGGNALVGDGLKVGSDMLLDQGFTAVGAIRLPGVHIGGDLVWAPRSPVLGLVDLERSAVHRLNDDWSHPDAYWPPAGRLRLAGFTYDSLGGQHQASWRQRLDWIRKSHVPATGAAQAVFAAPPYEQLARMYRQTGQEKEARQVAIARRSDLRRYGSLTRLRRFGNWLLDQTIRHGYQPLRAVGLLFAVWVAVLLVFWGAQHQDRVIVPAKDVKNIEPAPTALHCSPDYPCFYPAGYAVDVVVPIINLRQAENWRPNGRTAWGWAYIAVGWIATGLGWAFTTLAVAGYTGLVRKD